jgi:hypothetical protein
MNANQRAAEFFGHVTTLAIVVATLALTIGPLLVR